MNEIETAIAYWAEFKQEAVDMIAKGKDYASALAEQIPMCDIALTALREKAERENPKPLTMGRLKQMDNKTAYLQFGDGAEGNAVLGWEGETLYLYGPAFDDHSEPDLDLYGMEYDDPDGHFGLHLLGWLAYDHEPKH